MPPQSLPWAWQVVGVHGLGPQTLGVPPPPQVMPPAHVPQLRTPPQPSGTSSQSKASSAQLFGLQPGLPQTCSTPPPPQVVPSGQPPQSSVPPQLSGMAPQFL